MKLDPHHHKPALSRAFSLIEMLVVIAVIGVIAAIGVTSVSDVNEAAKTARDQRNAQDICSMFNGANVAGVAFASDTKEGILDELIDGKTSPDTGINFKFTSLDSDQKSAALDYLEYDGSSDLMKYSSQPIVAAAAAADAGGTTPAADPPADSEPSEPVYGEWTNFELRNNHQLVGRLDQLRAQMPEREWRWVPADPYMHDTSQIQFRTVD